MLQYNKFILSCIEQEKNGTAYCCPKADKALLSRILREINRQAGTDFHYLAELDILGVSGVGQIYRRLFIRKR